MLNVVEYEIISIMHISITTTLKITSQAKNAYEWMNENNQANPAAILPHDKPQTDEWHLVNNLLWKKLL